MSENINDALWLQKWLTENTDPVIRSGDLLYIRIIDGDTIVVDINGKPESGVSGFANLRLVKSDRRKIK